jgi:dienelactone hydrolase
MNTTLKLLPALFLFVPLLAADAPRDPNAARDLNTPRTFPEIESRAEWQKRAEEIREHVQFATGLYPLPEKTPLNARLFGRIERDGYSVEKVYFETYPGFFLAGNLYRPLGKGTGPFPAVLNPHGHWKEGRMANGELGSIAARCISFARQGMVAFSYDMVGYNDTIQVDHKFASDPANLLWNISLMGLQTWNSIRALDFLESLPDVNKKRLACTGESGGGTQTFILGAIDKRLAAQAPVVMVSHSMQGGCLCENAPGLRVDYSNMEIAAAPAPRPQILVAAIGDWTKKTMEVEGPSIEKIYKLFRAEDRFDYKIFNYEHNYNKDSREAVYAFFGKWLLNEKNPENLKEKPYTKEPDADLRVFPDGKLPAEALGEAAFIKRLVQIYSRQLDDLKPTDAKSLKTWKAQMQPAWEHALQLQHVRGGIPQSNGENIVIRRQPDDAEVTFWIREPAAAARRNDLIVLRVGQLQKDTLSDTLNDKGIPVASIVLQRVPAADEFKNYYQTYNRTYAQDTVANIKVAADYLRGRFPKAKLVLLGQTELGSRPSLLAAPLADAVVADCLNLDESKDADLLKPGIFFPGIRRVGSLQGIAALAAPNPLFIHNFSRVQSDWLPALYQKNSAVLKIQKERASDSAIAEWVMNLASR